MGVGQRARAGALRVHRAGCDGQLLARPHAFNKEIKQHKLCKNRLLILGYSQEPLIRNGQLFYQYNLVGEDLPGPVDPPPPHPRDTAPLVSDSATNRVGRGRGFQIKSSSSLQCSDLYLVAMQQ